MTIGPIRSDLALQQTLHDGADWQVGRIEEGDHLTAMAEGT